MRLSLLIFFICISGYSSAETHDKFFRCMEGLKKDSRFSSIANHVALEGQGTASRKILSDKMRPDEQQKQALTEWIDARSQCVNLSPNPAWVNLHMAFVDIAADLYNGRTTFGEFNKKWQTLYKKEINTGNTHE